MREFETTFVKGLKRGLREDEDNPRNEEALIECLNAKPSEEGLIPIVPITTPMVVSMAWPFPQVFSGLMSVASTTIISSTSDGYIRKTAASYSDWDYAHDAEIGSGYNPIVENYSWAFSVRYIACTGGYCYQIRRCFFYFDLSEVSGTVSSCSLMLRGDTKEDVPVSVQQGTQADPLTTADYDAFTGSLFGYTDWDASGDNTITFNSTGIAYIQSVVNASGVALLCCREYDYDYLDVAPSEDDNFGSGCYYAESVTEAYRPALTVCTRKVE